jgi:hypothetical protein
MKIKMLVDSRVFFEKGSTIEVNEREAARLLSLGFAAKAEAVKAAKVEIPEKVEPAETAETPEKEDLPKVNKKRKK